MLHDKSTVGIIGNSRDMLWGSLGCLWAWALQWFCACGFSVGTFSTSLGGPAHSRKTLRGVQRGGYSWAVARLRLVCPRGTFEMFDVFSPMSVLHGRMPLLGLGSF